MKNKIFASAIYIVSFVLITLLAGGIFTIINKCEYYENRLSGILILLPIIGFLFSRIVKLPQLGIIFWLILPAFSLIFEYHSTQNMIEKRLDSKINVVVKAVVTDLKKGKVSKTLAYSYIYKSERYNEIQRRIKFGKLNDIYVGDTILIRFDERCRSIKRIYNFSPTKDILEKCKSECFLIDNNLFINDRKTIVATGKLWQISQPTIWGYSFIAFGIIFTGIIIWINLTNPFK